MLIQLNIIKITVVNQQMNILHYRKTRDRANKTYTKTPRIEDSIGLNSRIRLTYNEQP